MSTLSVGSTGQIVKITSVSVVPSNSN